jgi:hypothetical protein
MASSTPVNAGNAAFGNKNIDTLPGGDPKNPSIRLLDISQLSLANGMTAGYGVNDGNVDNPPMAVNAPSPLNAYGDFTTSVWPVQRIGVLRNVPGQGPLSAGKGAGQAAANTTYSLYFLFNPNEIQATFTINTGSLPAQYLYGTSNTAGYTTDQSNAGGTDLPTSVASVTTSQLINWTLLFDRTYDMAYDQNPNFNRGVLKDVAALYNIMGTFSPGQGYPSSYPVQVAFGMTGSGQLWGFTGYISSVNITYGTFRHNMIPSRCSVDLSMQLSYVSPSVNPSSSELPGISPGDQPAGTPPPLPSWIKDVAGVPASIATAKKKQAAPKNSQQTADKPGSTNPASGNNSAAT